MNGFKRWFFSKGIWGGLVTMAIAALKLSGYEIPEGSKELLVGNTEAVVIGAAGLLSWWGRLKASQKIGK